MRHTMLISLVGAMLVLRSASGIPQEWLRGPVQSELAYGVPAVVGAVDVVPLNEDESEDDYSDEETLEAQPETSVPVMNATSGGNWNSSKPSAMVQAGGKWPSHQAWGHKGNVSEEQKAEWRRKFQETTTKMMTKMMQQVDARKVVQLLNVTCAKLRSLPVGEYDDLVAGTNSTKLQHFVIGFLKELANVTGLGKHHGKWWSHHRGHRGGAEWSKGSGGHPHHKNCTKEPVGHKDQEGHGEWARKDRVEAGETSEGGRGDRGEGGRGHKGGNSDKSEGRNRDNKGGRGEEEGRGRGQGDKAEGKQGGLGKFGEGSKGDGGGLMGGTFGGQKPMGGGMGTGGVNGSTVDTKPVGQSLGKLFSNGGLSGLSEMLGKMHSGLNGAGGGGSRNSIAALFGKKK